MTHAAPSAAARIRSACVAAIFSLGVTIILLLLLEGVASAIFVVRDAVQRPLLRERSHTQYDPEVGWVNTPDLYIKDLYGPGVFFKSNAQGFRNDREFSPSAPPDKLRIICSGDSFTFGFGVDNDHTWCQLLASLDPRLETVNLGEVGYGIDQAYLLYKRHNASLQHDVHLFAFVGFDFGRMESRDYVGYGKPRLEVRDGVLVNTRNPVPRSSFLSPRMGHSWHALQELNLVKLLKNPLLRTPPRSSGWPGVGPHTLDLGLKIFEELQKLSRDNNSTLVLVLLPTYEDYVGVDGTESMRLALHDEAVKRNWRFIDLFDEFRARHPLEAKSLFSGHYSEQGNAYVAGLLYRELLVMPEIAARLAQKTNSSSRAAP